MENSNKSVVKNATYNVLLDCIKFTQGLAVFLEIIKDDKCASLNNNKIC